jgi:hypothetical protein
MSSEAHNAMWKEGTVLEVQRSEFWLPLCSSSSWDLVQLHLKNMTNTLSIKWNSTLPEML